MSTELDGLNQRLGDLIKTTCNVIGCKECPYKWDSGCSSNELQNQILDIEMEEYDKG